MRILKILFLYTIVSTFSLVSCGKEVSLCTAADFNARLNEAISDFTTAQIQFTSDPGNTEKCEAFKTAYRNYINDLKDLTDCAILQGRDEFQNDLNDAEDDLEDLEC